MRPIEVEDLTKRFGRFTAVDHVSFSVEKGEIFGLLGPNGAGKSTLVRMLCTLLQPTEGSARVAGFDIRKAPSRVREHIGLVTEKHILYERLSAAENLTLFGRLNHLPDKVVKEQTERWLKLIQMERWRDRPVKTFSTGMKQRINILRSLLHQPEVLFLDEPTLGLDPQTTRSIRELICQLSQQGITIVLTTHIMVEAELICHRVGIMDQAKIAAIDTPANLKRAISQDGAAILEVEISNPSQELASCVGSLECVNSLIQRDTHQWRVLAQGADALDKIIDEIRAKGGQIRTLSTIEPSLEDVFLHFTGGGMREDVVERTSWWRRPRWRRRKAKR